MPRIVDYNFKASNNVNNGATQVYFSKRKYNTYEQPLLVSELFLK